MPTYAYQVRDDMSNGPPRPVSARCGGRERPAPDELDGERAATGRRGILGGGDPLEQQADGLPPHRPEGLLDRRQVERLPDRHADIGEDDDGEVLGDADPDAASRVERAESDEVVGREDRGRPRARCEQVEPPLVAAVVAELPDTAERIVEFDAAGLEALAEALLSVAARRRVSAAGGGAHATVA